MLSARSLAPVLSAVAAIGLAIAGGLAPDAEARAAVTKGAAPDLTIESKVCTIGQLAEDRSATITASAILGDDGDRVSMRFTIQQRPDAKSKWKSVPGAATAKSGLGTWENGQSGRAGLRYAKTINGLAEGVQYRVAVDARGLSEAGKVVTRTSRRYVPCTQPLFTPTLTLVKATDTPAGDGTHDVTVNVRNAGRLPATADGVVTVADSVTREILATDTFDPLKGGGQTKVSLPVASCPGRLYITVQFEDADPATIATDQFTTVDCKATQSRKRQRR